jgi:hypothetical protein
MNKLIQLTLFAILSVLLIAETSFAQERANESVRPSPNASVSQTIGTTEVTVNFGRPGIKDRTYFAEDSDLAPIGGVWRTGANEATTITFSDDVIFGGQEVAAGTYTLFTIPNGDDWTVILNTALTREDGSPTWGAFTYDEAYDATRVSAAVVNNNAVMMEWFNIYFDTLSDTKAHLNLHWGTTMVAVPITTN